MVNVNYICIVMYMISEIMFVLSMNSIIDESRYVVDAHRKLFWISKIMQKKRKEEKNEKSLVLWFGLMRDDDNKTHLSYANFTYSSYKCTIYVLVYYYTCKTSDCKTIYNKKITSFESWKLHTHIIYVCMYTFDVYEILSFSKMSIFKIVIWFDSSYIV